MGFASLFVSDVFHLPSHAAPLDLFAGCARSTALFMLQQSSQGTVVYLGLCLYALSVRI